MQFGRQEPDDEATIKNFVTTKYGVTFPMFAKVNVNGANAHPVFKYLRSSPEAGTQDISWNFAKFLVDRDGKIRQRYGTRTKPSSIEADIEKLLG